MVATCCAYGCTERAVKGGPITFHCFPKDEERKKIWEIKIRRENFKATKSSRVCSKHFTTDSFNREKFGGTWLKKTAVPTIFDFPKHLIKKKTTRKAPESITEHGKPADVYDVTNSDWVPSLNMGYVKIESCLSTKENYSNDEHKTCMSKKRPLINEEISISTSYPDNNALLFSQRNLQQQKSFQGSKLLSTENTYVIDNPVIQCTHSRTSHISKINKSTFNVKPTVSNIITQNESCRNFTFKNLAKNLSVIKRPNEFWSISEHSNFIVCARWSPDYICEKRIVIDDSLTIRIFLKNWEAVNLSELMKIASIDEISNLLVKVESYKIIKLQDLQ